MTGLVQHEDLGVCRRVGRTGGSSVEKIHWLASARQGETPCIPPGQSERADGVGSAKHDDLRMAPLGLAKGGRQRRLYLTPLSGCRPPFANPPPGTGVGRRRRFERAEGVWLGSARRSESGRWDWPRGARLWPLSGVETPLRASLPGTGESYFVARSRIAPSWFLNERLESAFRMKPGIARPASVWDQYTSRCPSPLAMMW